MESPAQRCTRIVVALEDLVAQEAAALRTRDFAAAVELQDRAAPLVEFLAARAGREGNTPELRERLDRLHARRQESADWLQQEIATVRGELDQTNVARRRVAQIAPVYGRAQGRSSQLRAIG